MENSLTSNVTSPVSHRHFFGGFQSHPPCVASPRWPSTCPVETDISSPPWHFTVGKSMWNKSPIKIDQRFIIIRSLFLDFLRQLLRLPDLKSKVFAPSSIRSYGFLSNHHQCDGWTSSITSLLYKTLQLPFICVLLSHWNCASNCLKTPSLATKRFNENESWSMGKRLHFPETGNREWSQHSGCDWAMVILQVTTKAFEYPRKDKRSQENIILKWFQKHGNGLWPIQNAAKRI